MSEPEFRNPRRPPAGAPYLFFASCPKGMESLLAAELNLPGAVEVRETVAGVWVSGKLELAYRICLWSRLASRLLLTLGDCPARDEQALYDGVQEIRWKDHLDPGGTLWVHFDGTNANIVNTQYGARRIKDAVVDQLRESSGRRPTVQKERPDIRIHAFLRGDTAQLALDLSGESLHRRGYRIEDRSQAPLKENLAAAMLIRAGWPDMAASGSVLLDPMCGSGTLLIEGALLAADIPPGLARSRFGFAGWLNHRPEIWQRVRAEAEQQNEEGRRRKLPPMFGSDADPAAVAAARRNIERAGFTGSIQLIVRELAALDRPSSRSGSGLLITNPPYGHRLGDAGSLAPLYRFIGQRLRESFTGWKAALLAGNPELGKTMGLRSCRQYALWNGKLPCRLLLFDVNEEWFVKGTAVPPHRDTAPPETKPPDRPRPAAGSNRPEGFVPLPAAARAADRLGQPAPPGPRRPADVSSIPAQPAGEGPQMLANRLRKNLRLAGRWARREGISCYRLYDADLKEYAAAIDRYGDWLHIQEYAPPPSIEPATAGRRLNELVETAAAVLAVPLDRVALKQRQRQRKGFQYSKLATEDRWLEVEEAGARYLVNLTGYLDTGLFLDHRPVRRLIGELARGRRFLNLCCYTATASIAAARGGAAHTTSVDLSPVYLDWAQKNFAANGFSSRRHLLVQADVFKWLEECREQFDLIFLDPPTYSKSKRTPRILDVQRDHPRLIRQAMSHLAPGGTLIFSNNFRAFKFDAALLAGFRVEEITARTIDPDFRRRPRIHHCFLIRRGNIPHQKTNSPRRH